MQKPSLLADLIDIQAQIAHDQPHDRAQLQQRDRAIGIGLPSHHNAAGKPADNRKNLHDLRHWIKIVRQQSADAGNRGATFSGDSVQQSVNITLFVLWLGGLIGGWFLTQTVLHYDGAQPLNLINSLLVLVGFQLFMLLLLIIFAAGGFDSISTTVAIFNPAAIVVRLLRKLHPSGTPIFTTRLTAALPTGAEFTTRRLLVYLGQHFTVAFNVGIIAALIYLVTVSDLAFGWSTSLKLDTDTMYRWLHRLATPWNTLLPLASPERELVEASRYYRLQSQLQNSPLDPWLLATWWRYLLAAIVTYGLLPRLLALLICGLSYHRAIASTIMTSPNASQILARMRAPLVTTNRNDCHARRQTTAPPAAMRQRRANAMLSCQIIEWALAQPKQRVSASQLKAANIQPQQFFAAGGNSSIRQDQSVIARLAADSPTAVAIVVKAWEPPLAEFVDFITELRLPLAADCALIILLLPLADSIVDAQQRAMWATELARLNDAKLYLQALQCP